MPKLITLLIDNQKVSVPAGTLIVDAAKKIGNDIPVFCYHPKMEPAGACRMCLVEIGRPAIDRSSGQPLLNADGSPRIQFGPKLETACTTPVSEGMQVVTASAKVKDARKEVVEFLLTSHPLDCPVCDKGGECPLQNLTLGFGPGTSRFSFDEKMHLGKQVALGELILLDRERCIQCGRCVRFQHELVDDAVINFFQRGRSLQIVTNSEPGFDSIFSGNTTDICPVGALTTVDFHFGARPWELNAAASLCSHCPVGCNIVYNVRREARSGGKTVIKRVMPRQNEQVNEIWMCDKGRFAYHYTESPDRLTQPLVRKNGELQPASWDEALTLVEAWLREAGDERITLVGGRLPNEDLYNLLQLGGKPRLYTHMAGGDLVTQFGLPPGSNLGDLSKGSAILVVASDLHEEAPVWWLRIKQAARRGAALIVANPRPTRLDKFASHTLRYAYGDETNTVRSLLFADGAPEDMKAAAQAIAAAENLVVFYGSDGLGLVASAALAQACAELLSRTAQHPNNGLVAVWPHANTQGAWELGFRPSFDLVDELRQARVVLVAAADPAGDDPRLAEALDAAGFVIVQELFLTETANRADVVLPVRAYTEREGTYISGERRLQRFYPAVSPQAPGPRPDFEIASLMGARLGLKIEGQTPALILLQMAESLPAFTSLTYQKLAETGEQWPIIGRHDLYYGGTMYDNNQGLGVTLPLSPVSALPAAPVQPYLAVPSGGLLVAPVTRLYDQGTTLAPSYLLLQQRLEGKSVWMNPATADRLALSQGDIAYLELDRTMVEVEVHLDEGVPLDVLLLPRTRCMTPKVIAREAIGILIRQANPVGISGVPEGAADV